MWYAGQIADALHYAADFGFKAPLQSFDWAALVKNREAYIDRIHLAYQRGFDSNGVRVIDALGVTRLTAACWPKQRNAETRAILMAAVLLPCGAD